MSENLTSEALYIRARALTSEEAKWECHEIYIEKMLQMMPANATESYQKKLATLEFHAKSERKRATVLADSEWRAADEQMERERIAEGTAL